jgi:hypothetical protein
LWTVKPTENTTETQIFPHQNGSIISINQVPKSGVMLPITSSNHIFYLIHKKHSNYYGFYNYIYNTTSTCKTSVTHVKNPAKKNWLQVLAYSIVTRKQLKCLTSWEWTIFPEAMFTCNTIDPKKTKQSRPSSDLNHCLKVSIFIIWMKFLYFHF